jgi:hypothetical protein
MKHIKLYENYNKEKCINLNPPKEVIDFVCGFDSDETLLRKGGLPTEMFDRWAYGFDDSLDIIHPRDLLVKWDDDLENVEYEVEYKGMSDVEYSLEIDLSEPIEVSYEKGEQGYGFYIEDGHHRYFASKTLDKSLNMELRINCNPIEKITNGMLLDYDLFMRCLYFEARSKRYN